MSCIATSPTITLKLVFHPVCGFLTVTTAFSLAEAMRRSSILELPGVVSSLFMNVSQNSVPSVEGDACVIATSTIIIKNIINKKRFI